MVIDRAAAAGLFGVTNVFALLRLLPMSSRDKDAEILVLRYQLSVLQRQASGNAYPLPFPETTLPKGADPA